MRIDTTNAMITALVISLILTFSGIGILIWVYIFVSAAECVGEFFLQ